MKTPFFHFLILLVFLVNTLGPFPVAQAQEFKLPAPGVMVRLSPPLDPPILKGIKVHPYNPFRFDFILDKGDSASVIPAKAGIHNQEQLKTEATKLIKYFLASLTIPEKDLWVNLSPYEKDRIIPQSFGLTEMGRDLLAEDYMLKQITASLIYPEDEIGKKFWKRVYQEAAKRYGTTNIPVNTFNKVWIVPEKAVVYENAKAGTAYVVESKLKVMLEQDYLALEKNTEKNMSFPNASVGNLGIAQTLDPRQIHSGVTNVSSLGSQIVREVVIPELTKEVNENKNFAQLRQVYNSLILATWYKKKIKDSILAQIYDDKNKIQGLSPTRGHVPLTEGKGYVSPSRHDMDPRFRGDDNRKDDVEFIYQRYLQAFKKGVYNYIKEDYDPATQEAIPRKYFSGGESFSAKDLDLAMQSVTQLPSQEEIGAEKGTDVDVDVNFQPIASQHPVTKDTQDINNLILISLEDQKRFSSRRRAFFHDFGNKFQEITIVLDMFQSEIMLKRSQDKIPLDTKLFMTLMRTLEGRIKELNTEYLKKSKTFENTVTVTKSYMEKAFTKEIGDEIFEWLMMNGYFYEEEGIEGRPRPLTGVSKSNLKAYLDKNKEKYASVLIFDHEWFLNLLENVRPVTIEDLVEFNEFNKKMSKLLIFTRDTVNGSKWKAIFEKDSTMNNNYERIIHILARSIDFLDENRTFREFSLREMVNAIWSDLKNENPRIGPPELMPKDFRIVSDSVAVDDIIENIIINGVTAISKRMENDINFQGKGEIRIAGAVESDGIKKENVIRITTNGGAMSEDGIRYILGGGEGYTTKGENRGNKNGIGLSSCLTEIKNLKGSMDITADTKKGETTFTIVLPQRENNSMFVNDKNQSEVKEEELVESVKPVEQKQVTQMRYGRNAPAIPFQLAGRDQAMKTKREGGIDLTPANMKVQVKTGSPTEAFGDDKGRLGDNEGIKFHLDPAMLAELQKAPGFVPVIINIRPLNDLRQFLGINSTKNFTVDS